MYLSVTLKIAFSNFLSLRKSFSASLALHSLHLLSCTKHIISVLRSSKLVILCMEALTWHSLQKKSSNTWKSVFCIANNISFHEKKHLSCTWAYLLKLHLATFSHWERSFSASVALHSLHLLSCTKHSISVLRRSKPVILCIEALTLLALQKSSLATFSHWERSFSASLALHSLHCLVALNISLVCLEALN